MDKLIATITGIGGITGTLSGRGLLSGSLCRPSIIPVDDYTGEYEVTPQFTEQVLATQGYRMAADVTVHEIPVVFTTNIYGGKTVVIG